MPSTLTPNQFVDKWRFNKLNERAACQEHFLDLCRLLDHPTPSDLDPDGRFFRFEAGAGKVAGGDGFADVWYKGYFAWEYKGKHADLDKAYNQLLQYRESLENPPLLIVSDTDRIQIHTNFTNTPKKIYDILLSDIQNPRSLDLLRAAFYSPEKLRMQRSPIEVTQKAAADFARLADLLRARGCEAHAAAHFLIRILFCLFAEDVALLPNNLFSRLALNFRANPPAFNAQLSQLFSAMSAGTAFGIDPIPHFNGHLFNNADVLDLGRDGLEIIIQVGSLDWSAIEPSIFGTLFERSLDPAKRSQLGAHYTGKDDILLILEPVLMAPLRRAWDALQPQARGLAAQRDQAKGPARVRLNDQLIHLLTDFAARLASLKILDAACGSGNFLYLALRLLLDLEKEVIGLAAELGLTRFFPTVGPSQLYGIEINPTAHQLAQATIWIGYIQWLRENGFGVPTEPILKPLDTIQNMDAILAWDANGQPYEPEWPAVDVIIGNPPFLGGNKIRAELGNSYVDALFKLYKARIPAFADLVCYWFEKARAMIEIGKAKRAGLLATQAIRGGVNRKVLERIKGTGDIFWAQSDRNWILNGATVHVSMIGFDNNIEISHILNDYEVSIIHTDLTAEANLTSAAKLPENLKLCFIGTKKAGDFDIDESLAHEFMTLSNPHGKSNSEVIFKWMNGKSIVSKVPQRWIIYFREMSITDASLFEGPFEYVKRNIYPERQNNNEERARIKWWLHRRPAIEMWDGVRSLQKYIATPRVSKHRIFIWVPNDVLPDDGVYIFARDDDYFFGLLHSCIHELWARATGTQLREAESGFRYTPNSTFETFPFPWPPGKEPLGDSRVEAIAQAARELVQYRDNWLNPPNAPEAELKKRTLTNLYNQRPSWLQNAHRKLDQAVFAAYAWPDDLTDEEILTRLLALNQQRFARQLPNIPAAK